MNKMKSGAVIVAGSGLSKIARAVGNTLREQWRIITSNGLGRFGATIILFFGVVAILAPLIAPHDPWETLRDANNKFASLRSPSWEYPLGTTSLGRDILSQMIHATRATMIIGLISGFVSIVIGANIGLLAGYYGGKLDEVLMRFTDIVYGMPFLPFIIVLISLFGRSHWFVVLAIVVIIWRTSARGKSVV